MALGMTLEVMLSTNAVGARVTTGTIRKIRRRKIQREKN